MAWKQCTSAFNADQSVFINLDNVAKIAVNAQGSHVTFVGLADISVTVVEPPLDIILGSPLA